MPNNDALHHLIDAITAYIGWVDLVLQAADDDTLFRRLRGLHKARVTLLDSLQGMRHNGYTVPDTPD